MVFRVVFRDLRARVREALLAWAVLTASALILTLIATPLASWMDRTDLAVLMGFVMVAPLAACALWWALSAVAKQGVVQERMTPVRPRRRPGTSVTLLDSSWYEEEDQHVHPQ